MKILFKDCSIIAGEEFREIKNGFLGVDDSRICWLSETAPQDTKTYDCVKSMTGKVLFPGLYNTHSHSAMTLLRGAGSDLPLKEWLFDTIFPLEDRLNPEFAKTGTQLAILEMLASGTVSFSDMYYMCEASIEAAAESGIKMNTARCIQALDPDEKYEDSYRARESIGLFRNYHGSCGGRILVDFAIHGEYTTSENVARKYSEKCAEYGGRMHIHLSETRSEHEDCIRRHGMTPAEWFRSIGTFASPTAAAHCVWCTDNDFRILKEYGVFPVHNPTSNMKLGSGFAPVPKMIRSGLTVGLGTDSAASNNNLNLMEEIHSASVLHNGISLDATIMDPRTVLKMATVNGAVIQGRPDCGFLAVGRHADIIAFDLNRPHLMPAPGILPLLCYAAQGSDVCMTMVDGRILYENGEYLTLDKERVFHDVKKAAEKLYG